MADFTKGEWKATKAVSGNWLIMPKTSGQCIARSVSSEANAHLIAAAPDMYKVLTGIKELANGYGEIPVALEI